MKKNILKVVVASFTVFVFCMSIIDIQPVEAKAAPSQSYSKNLIVIVVNDSLRPYIQSSLDVYKKDLEIQGFKVTQKSWQLSGSTPQQLKDYLKNLYNTSGGSLKGAVFVGDLPVAWFWRYFWIVSKVVIEPTDLFYMDLGTKWKSHKDTFETLYNTYTYNDIYRGSSPVEIEENQFDSFEGWAEDPWYWFGGRAHLMKNKIYIGRLTVSPLTSCLNSNEAQIISDYFTKNHLYRIGIRRREGALSWHTGAWRELVDVLDDSDLREFYNSVVVVFEADSSTLPYEEYLKKNYEWLKFIGHSNIVFHGLGIQPDVYTGDIVKIGPNPYFYYFATCLIGRFTADGYMSGAYIFAKKSSGLCAVAMTHTTGLLPSARANFHSLVGQGNTIGEAFIEAFDLYDLVLRVMPKTIIGDPTLKISKFQEGGIPLYKGRNDISITGYLNSSSKPYYDIKSKLNSMWRFRYGSWYRTYRMYPRYGYRLYMKEPTALSLDYWKYNEWYYRVYPYRRWVHLRKGWNFVAPPPRSQPADIGKAITSINWFNFYHNRWNVSSVYAWNAEKQAWDLWRNGQSSPSLKKIVPGKGYWIYLYDSSYWKPWD